MAAGKIDKKNGAISLGSKRKIDLYLGIALAWTFEFLAFAAGFVFRRNHKDVPHERILIMKFSGMGSLAIAYPSILELKRAHPDSHIVFWGTRQTTALAKELAVFDEILELDDRSLSSAFLSLVSNLRRLWSFKAHWAYDLEIYSKLSSVLCLWSLSLNRIGFISDTTGFRKYLHTHLIYFNRFRYVGDLYRSMLLGDECAGVKTDYAAELKIPAEPARRIVVNINSGELFSLRRWPAEDFKVLLERLLDRFEHEIALTGSSGEADEVASLLSSMTHPEKGRIKDLSGKLSLKELIKLLKNSSLFITNDSGPLHLAVLMSTPTIALFGPTHPAHLLPAGRADISVIYHDFICSPCVHVIDHNYLPCKGLAPCMTSISVDEVFMQACSMVGEARGKDGVQNKIRGSVKTYARE